MSICVAMPQSIGWLLPQTTSYISYTRQIDIVFFNWITLPIFLVLKFCLVFIYKKVPSTLSSKASLNFDLNVSFGLSSNVSPKSSLKETVNVSLNFIYKGIINFILTCIFKKSSERIYKFIFHMFWWGFFA